VKEPLHVEHRDGVCELTLNRPQRRNALSHALLAALDGALAAAGSDATVRSVLVTGAPPAFCAGLDLGEVGAPGVQVDQHDTRSLYDLYQRIDGLGKPVIAAVNGPAVAGGAGLACACDIVVCGASAQMGYPGVRHGLVAPVVMPHLLRMVGERVARYLLLTGEVLTANTALAVGLANEVVPDADLLPRARQIASLFLAYPAAAVAQTKSILARLRSLHGADLVEQVRRMSAAVVLTAEAREAMQRVLTG
jgi:methylglutaconyl-CoA hydratase